MCLSCPDFVTDCWEPDCLGPEFLPDGRRNLYARSSKFYLDTTLCGHLQQRYGVTTGRALENFLRSRPGDEEPAALDAWLGSRRAEFQDAFRRRQQPRRPWWRRAVRR